MDEQRGSVLVLMPAAVVVVLVLASLALDAGHTFLAQRELVSATEAAANDSVTVALDRSLLRDDGTYRLDPGRVAEVAAQTFSARGLEHVDFRVAVAGPTVTVEATQTVHPIIAGALDRASGPTQIRSVATARAVEAG